MDYLAAIDKRVSRRHFTKDPVLPMQITALQHVVLPGFSYGFIGGASGRTGSEIVFNGDITMHPDCGKMLGFIRERGLTVKWFSGYPLTDIGTIL